MRSGLRIRLDGIIPWLARLPVFWLIAFLLGPLALIIVTSIAKRGLYGGIEWTFSIENFLRAFDALYLMIFLRSFALASSTTLLCALIGLPVALAIATAKQNHRPLLALLIAIPFLTNLIVRIYALKLFTAHDGWLASLLNWLAIPFDPFVLSQNSVLVLYGMVTTYLPFMIFPLYNALERFDFSIIEAAEDLGARPTQVLLKVILPNLRPALLSGSSLVLIPALGEFVIPDLLGGAKTMLAGNLITEQFLKARDWPFGAALSLLLIVLIGTALVINQKLSRTSHQLHQSHQSHQQETPQ